MSKQDSKNNYNVLEPSTYKILFLIISGTTLFSDEYSMTALSCKASVFTHSSHHTVFDPLWIDCVFLLDSYEICDNSTYRVFVSTVNYRTESKKTESK